MHIAPRFKLGSVVGTPGAMAALQAAGTDPRKLLLRHSVGDWGELDPEDIQANEDALSEGLRLSRRSGGYGAARGWTVADALSRPPQYRLSPIT